MNTLQRVITRTVCFYIVALSLFAITGCTKKQESTEKKISSIPGDVLATTAVLATFAEKEIAPSAEKGSKHTTIPGAQGPATDIVVELNSKGRGVAYLAQVDGKVHVVHNGKTGKLYERIENMVLSPDGQRVAYGAFSNDKWRIVVDEVEKSTYQEIGPPAFSPDNQHIAYEFKLADKWHVVVDSKVSAGCPSYFAKPEFSADSSKIIFVENTEQVGKMRAVVSDLEFKKVIYKELSGKYFVLNSLKNRFAADLITNGKSKIIEIELSQPDVVKEGASFDSVYPPQFNKGGDSVSYIGIRGRETFIVANGMEERVPAGDIGTPPVLRPDKKGVAFFIAQKSGGKLHQAFFNDGVKEQAYPEAADLVYSADSQLKAFCAKKANGWCVVVNGAEGPVFDRVVTPQFSPDGKIIVYRARKGGKRFVVVADTKGVVIRQHPGYDRVFEPVFTVDCASVAYGVVDGRQIVWKVEKL